MREFFEQSERLLRAELEPDGIGSAPRTYHLVLSIVLYGIAYGAVMGSFGGIANERGWQILFSATKVPLLLLATFCLSLPSFFVLNTLVGLRADFGQAIRALLATQAGLTIILVALAPFTALWYASVDDYNGAILFNGAMFATASGSAQWLLRRYYAPLIARDRRHRQLLRAWLVLYSFVAIQMAWLLRPFIGDPNSIPEFFRRDSWGNAYVVVFRLVWNAL